MYHTTGLAREEIHAICESIMELGLFTVKPRGRRKSLSLFKAVTATLTYLRRNIAQQFLAEMYDVSQATISRTISTLTGVVEQVLNDYVPTVEDLDPDAQLIVDGTLLPCWSWETHPENHSGKHHTTGLNVQVACTLSGHLAWVSDPTPGHTHDAKAIRASGLLDMESHPAHLGDKGYIGLNMLTPIRKPAHRELLEWEHIFNKDVNSIRYQIERTIANLKTWRILHTDYRRPIGTFPQTISTTIALQFYRMSF